MSDFQQTVNLKDKMKAQKEQVERAAVLREEEERAKVVAKNKIARKPLKKVLRKADTTASSKNNIPSAHDIDELFAVDREEAVAPVSAMTSVKREMHQINRPAPREINNGDDIYKKISGILFFLLILCLGYFLFFADKKQAKIVEEQIVPAWYAVKLTTGEVYYGEIGDTKADPVVVEKVYYDYDQLNGNPKSGEGGEAGNLRLVKRGKETHGPEGTMNIVRSQILFMEPLKEESKVLKAILNYEK